MTKNEKIVAGMLIGAAAGAAAVLFFETEKGKKLLEVIKQLASETVDDAVNRLAKVEEKFKEQMIVDDADEDTMLS